MAEKSFERKLVKRFDFGFDFDETKFNRFLAKTKLDLDSVPEQVLYDLDCGGLVDNAFVMNYAGVLFFATQPERFVKGNFVTCIRYKGDSVMHMIDRKDIYGDLVSLVDEAEKFVRANTKVASKFEGFTRIDIEEYPYLAIREAIVNAVCHRDYSNGNNIFINIFDSKIEVISPGSIPGNLSLKEVWGKSNPRNKAITSLFHKLGEKYVEKAGTGLKRMEEEMILKGLDKPRYQVNKAFFTVTFYGPGEKIFDLAKPSDRIDLRQLGLDERQVKALNYMQEKGVVSAKEYKQMFNITKKTAVRDLNKLIKLGFVSRTGKTHQVHYTLIDPNNKKMTQN